MSNKTKIVFSGGEELKVDGQPKQVRDRLSRKGARFARFKKTSAANVDVWVAVGQVAYIEQIPEQSVSAPTVARSESRRNPARQRSSGA